LGLLLQLTLLALILHVGIGSYLWIDPVTVMRELFRGESPGTTTANQVIWALRLPRAVGCALAGGLLGATGAAFQALFRNPLAEPYVIGVSSGAGVGGALATVLGLGAYASGLGVMAASFAGGLASLFLVLSLARHQGVVRVTTLLLAGVVVGSLLSSLMTLVILAAGEDTNRVLRWLLGSATPMFWNRCAIMAGVLVVAGAVLMTGARGLNAFAMGERQAQSLGVNPVKLKRHVLIAGTAMASVAVGAVGIVGFLGLVAPHIARRVVAVDLRWSLPAATLLGAVLMLAADLIAQRAIPGIELPVGAVTAVLGAPTLLLLLRQDRPAID